MIRGFIIHLVLCNVDCDCLSDDVSVNLVAMIMRWSHKVIIAFIREMRETESLLLDVCLCM